VLDFQTRGDFGRLVLRPMYYGLNQRNHCSCVQERKMAALRLLVMISANLKGEEGYRRRAEYIRQGAATEFCRRIACVRASRLRRSQRSHDSLNHAGPSATAKTCNIINKSLNSTGLWILGAATECALRVNRERPRLTDSEEPDERIR